MSKNGCTEASNRPLASKGAAGVKGCNKYQKSLITFGNEKGPITFAALTPQGTLLTVRQKE